jgi:RNA polymerase sigma-70 factor, ECF subfamily
LREHDTTSAFERCILPHLDAAYNLARWLTRDEWNARDLVQEACVRALRFFDGFHGGDGRAWLLAIVRNTCYTWLKGNRAQELATPFDEELHALESEAPSAESLLEQSQDQDRLRGALEELTVEYREVLVLRELEGLSYKEIAAVVKVPIGTVMSRLARGRQRLQQSLAGRGEARPQRSPT